VNLAEIFNEMLLEENNAILLLIGVGRQGEHLRNYQNVSQIKGNNVYQLGFKSNIANFLSVSDALVISSLNEGMPLVALESMSMGVPIITTPAGGMVDIVQDGENGFLAEGFSKENIKSAICRFLNTSDEKLTQMKINNTNRFEQKYSMPICAGKYEELYMKMLGNGNEVEKFGSVEAQ
jgi:glycosyltransferase involved in cell wall biosynthesis